jgi:DNA-binding NarL/FixJ family response regulator
MRVKTRAGLHTGECELIGDDLTGIAVHVAARVMGEAAQGEVLVSRTVKDLASGAGFRFVDRGVHALRGVSEEWQLYAVQQGGPGAEPGAPLSPREREVAALIAKGLTNKQIARSLEIAERTAENHVEHILTRLGFQSRAQIAVWAAQEHLVQG